MADDEASIRRILETRLKMAGYDVYTAADGEEAVAAFNKYNPDLVVLDAIKKYNLNLIEEMHQDQWVALVVKNYV